MAWVSPKTSCRKIGTSNAETRWALRKKSKGFLGISAELRSLFRREIQIHEGKTYSERL
jgi:hypothetical protein